MIPYQYVKIPEEIQEEIAKCVDTYSTLDRGQYHVVRKWDTYLFPLTKEFLSKLGLQIHFYRIFLHPPFFKNRIMIHKDTDDQKLAFNIPIQKQSVIYWYEDYANTGVLVGGRVNALLPYKEHLNIQEEDFRNVYMPLMLEYTKDWVPTCIAKMDRPLLVKTDIWHSAENKGNENRALVSFRFRDNPTFDIVTKLFQQAGLTE